MIGAKVDVVIPAYGDVQRLSVLLDALDNEAKSQNVSLTTIVSDDGSPVPLKNQLSDRVFGNLSLIFVRGNNAGPGAARNRGVARSANEWIAFLDADTVPALGWLRAVAERLAESSDVDGFEGAVHVPRDVGASPFAHATEISQDIAHGGANIFYRRASLERIGGFSSDYFDAKRKMHFREDNDLYFRAVTSGL
jgi:GT2 family glycosyltransferase